MAQETVSKRPLHILLVEDNDDHAMIVIRNLKREGIVDGVVRVEDGLKAIRYLKKSVGFEDAKTPDIVLLDLKLPRMDGHEVLAHIKSDEFLRNIPIIVLTTSDADIDKMKAYNLHANSYLVKPLKAEDLRVMISNMTSYWGVWNRISPQIRNLNRDEDSNVSS